MPSRDFSTLPHKSQNVHAVFEIDPEILHTCLMRPCWAFYGCFFSVFFSLEIWDHLRPKYPKKYKNSNIWRKKKKKNPIRTSLGRGRLNTCKKIQGLSQKRRGHWTLKEEVGVLSAWTSLYVICCEFDQPDCPIHTAVLSVLHTYLHFARIT